MRSEVSAGRITKTSTLLVFVLVTSACDLAVENNSNRSDFANDFSSTEHEGGISAAKSVAYSTNEAGLSQIATTSCASNMVKSAILDELRKNVKEVKPDGDVRSLMGSDVPEDASIDRALATLDLDLNMITLSAKDSTTSSLSCEPSLVSSMLDDNSQYPVIYDIRPSLDPGGGVIVRSDVSKYADKVAVEVLNRARSFEEGAERSNLFLGSNSQ